jgi:hypothetical protein
MNTNSTPKSPTLWTVDELRPCSLQPFDGAEEVPGRERDVVHAGTASLEEAADGRVVPRWGSGARRDSRR